MDSSDEDSTLKWPQFSIYLKRRKSHQTCNINLRPQIPLMHMYILEISSNKHIHACIYVYMYIYMHSSFPIPVLFMHLSSHYAPKSMRTQCMRSAHVQHARASADHAMHRRRRKPVATDGGSASWVL
jgi:hypothetical protein